MKGIPIEWLLDKEVPLEAGDKFYCKANGLFTAGEMTIRFLNSGLYQPDLVLVEFKCSREGEFDAIYEMWRVDNDNV